MFLLVDGHHLLWRAVHAHGEHTAAKDVVTYFFRLSAKLKADNALVVWDSGKSRWRSEYYPEYKLHRESKKSEFDLQEILEQQKIARRVLALHGVRSVNVFGVEADDLISWFSEYLSKDHEVIIASRDRDLWQLLGNNRIRIFDTVLDLCVDRTYAETEFGISVDHFPEYKALVGDVSDNIKGVKGIGDKTAVDLLTYYGGFAHFFDEDVEKELKKKKATSRLYEQVDSLELSYKLGKLPSLSEMNYFLSLKEKEELRQALSVPIVKDPVQADLERSILGLDYLPVKFFEPFCFSGFVEGIDTLSYVNFSGFSDLDQAILNCSKCDLRANCGGGYPTLPTGFTDSEIMIICRNPSNEERTEGNLFAGRSGVRLYKFLETLGLSKDKCWITNVCKCPSENNKPVTFGVVKACSFYLQEEIRLVRPKLIVTFGDEAMSAVTPYASGSVSHCGEILDKIANGGYYVAIMVNPSYAICGIKNESVFKFGEDRIKGFLDGRRQK